MNANSNVINSDSRELDELITLIISRSSFDSGLRLQ